MGVSLAFFFAMMAMAMSAPEQVSRGYPQHYDVYGQGGAGGMGGGGGAMVDMDDFRRLQFAACLDAYCQ